MLDDVGDIDQVRKCRYKCFSEDQLLAINSHEQVAISVHTASSCGSSKNENSKSDSRFISFDVLWVE